MIWVFIVVGAVLVLLIAWFAITLVTTRLNNTPTLDTHYTAAPGPPLTYKTISRQATGFTGDTL